MRGDFSRLPRSKGTGYTAVLEQQGRVALDADANEQRSIDARLRRSETIDVIGEFGGPVGNEGFAITVSGDQILISAGRYYVDGLVAENPAPVSYDAQPVPVPSSDSSAATLLAMLPDQQVLLAVYLQVWQRLVTALDDPCLREPALGQADTTVREQTLWRVIARTDTVDVGSQPGPFCPALYGNGPAPSSGTLTVNPAVAASDCGCGPVAAAGYQGIENQLYRVEIHGGDVSDNGSAATFKWSRENGSVVSAVTGISAAPGGSGSILQVSSLGPDANLGFQVGQWVELTDDTYLYADPPNAPGTLYQVTALDQDALTLTVSVPVSEIDTGSNARVRRWDQSGPLALATGIPLSPGTAIELEKGISVTFGTGTYQPGDYWTFPARTATGTVEWPPCGSDGNTAQPPTSLLVHEAPLGCLYWVEEFERVRHQATASEPQAAESTAETAPEAFPTGRFGSPIPLTGPVSGPRPGPRPGPGPRPTGYVAVEDCRRSFRPLTAAPAIHVRSISWANDDVMPLDVLAANGLAVTLDQTVPGPVDGRNFTVTLESLPPAFLKVGSGLFTSYILEPGIVIDGQLLTWTRPTQAVLEAIEDQLAIDAEASTFARVRVRLLGQAIFTTAASGPIYLDGRAFGQPGTRSDGTTQKVDLVLPSGDGSLASDLESWFYLAPPLGVSLSLPGGNASFTSTVDANGSFGIVPTGSTGVTPVTEVSVTATFSYPAALTTTLGISLACNPSSETIAAVVPASVAITPGQTSLTFPVTFSEPQPGDTALLFSITATVASPVDDWQAQQTSSALGLTLLPPPLRFPVA